MLLSSLSNRSTSDDSLAKSSTVTVRFDCVGVLSIVVFDSDSLLLYFARS